jgi:ribosomal protein S18 acetylase RimI-like enzyme
VRVQVAQEQDIVGWLVLAAEVESLFGPLRDDPAFRRALERNIARGTAFCVRAADGPPGTRLLGGLLFSPARPDEGEHEIGWLAVSAECRRCGVGRLLVEHALGPVERPATIAVVTFAEESEAGQVAQRFYRSLGFELSDREAPGPDGRARRVLRRTLT